MNTLADINVVSPQVFANEALIHENFARLRREDPVHWTQREGYRPFWSVTKHADIIEIERQPERFLNDPRLTIVPIEQEEAVRRMTGGSHLLLRTLVHMDDPDHKAYRAITQTRFLGASLKQLEARMAELARRYVDRMVERGSTCDFVKEVGVWFPLHVIMSLLGVPESDEALMLKLTQELFGASDPELQRTPEIGTDAVQDFFAYFNALTEDRRVRPRNDLASVIANAKIDGKPLGPFETASYYVIIATAGHDTTSSSIAGGLLALIENPSERAKLAADPELLGAAADEMVRWTSPVRHFFRTATEDYTLRGKHIRPGDNLAMFYLSGNRDEEVFDDPFTFRVDRKPNPHLGFGHGVHHCLGNHLAKLEIRAFFAELLGRLEAIELAGTPKYVAANFVGGLKSLPIHYRLRAA